MLTPLVVIADKISDPVLLCLHQAHYSDPSRPIWLLTKQTNKIPNWVKRLDISLETKNGDRLTKKELLDLLHAITNTHGFASVWYLSTNTFLFDSLTVAEDTFGDIEIATVETLSEIISLYARAESLLALTQVQDGLDSVETRAEDAGLIHQSLQEVRMGHTFCGGIDNSFGYEETNNGQKKIQWVGRQPFFRQQSTQLVARAITLHFPVTFSSQIPKYYTGQGLWWLRLKAILGLSGL
jgi:hypothetical protein